MPPLDWEETVTFDLKPKPPLFKAKRTLSAVHVSHLPSLRLRKQKRSDVHELRRYSVSDFTCHVTFCESCTHTHTPRSRVQWGRVHVPYATSPRTIQQLPEWQRGSRDPERFKRSWNNTRTHARTLPFGDDWRVCVCGYRGVDGGQNRVGGWVVAGRVVGRKTWKKITVSEEAADFWGH